ncbi:GDSL esterase/lipase [Cardamine amara subsp. amara]|uniref:GDSL esterase/lipase n=1 Tax=Cardamine amara subsp. amara TaxID=228776 RepID=A0ABD0ZPP1_CARAN
MKECCKGRCVNVDKEGVKKYALCRYAMILSLLFTLILIPKKYTQEGWKPFYSVLGQNLTASLLKARQYVSINTSTILRIRYSDTLGLDTMIPLIS